MTSYGDRLRLALELAGRSRRELSKACDVTQAAISLCISGKTSAFAARNHSLASRFLGVDDLWLATGKGEPHPIGTSPLAQRIASTFDRLPLQQQERVYAAIMALLDVASDASGDAPQALRAPDLPTLQPSRRR